ncbi:MAG: acetolactate decarboxylase [Planctomycetota bacterium]
MKRIIVLALVALLPSCSLLQGEAVDRRETLAQVSTIDAILAGDYDGKVSCRRLLRFGGFGIGTFHALDGEMIVLDGTVYRVDAAGEVHVLAKDVKTPFACVTSFEPDMEIAVTSSGTDVALTNDGCPEIFPADALHADRAKEAVDSICGTPNHFLAVRIDGAFSYVRTRSVPRQKKPYPRLVEVTRNQPTFELRNVKGTIVGFRCPAFVKGINVPGYHLHFITEDRTGGGHVLDFKLIKGEIGVDVTPNFYLMLPAGEGAFEELDLTVDREKEVREAER